MRHTPRHVPLDPRTEDGLVAGQIAPEDAPPGYAETARLLAAARAEATDQERRWQPATVAAMAAIRSAAPARTDATHARRIGGSARARVGALVLAAALVGGTGLAFAATVITPGHHAPIETTPPTVVARPTLTDVPSASGQSGSTRTGSGGATGPDATGPAKFGLCNAYRSGNGGANGAKNDSVAFKNLEAAAAAAGQSVEDFCASATPGAKGSNSGAGGTGSGHGNGGANGARGGSVPNGHGGGPPSDHAHADGSTNGNKP